MDISSNDSTLGGTTIEKSEILINSDGTYYTIEQVRESLPFGTDIMHEIMYLRLNREILTESEIEMLELKIQRMNKAHTIRLKPELEEMLKVLPDQTGLELSSETTE